MKEELRRLQDVHEEEVNSLKSHINALSTLINNSVETINEVLASRIDHQQEEASSSRSQINSLTTQMRSMERKVELNSALLVNETNITSVSTCTGDKVLTKPSGYLAVVDSGLYPTSEDCGWEVKLPEDNDISLEWLFMSVEEQATCVFDYVTVENLNEPGQLLYGGKICGSSLPAMMKTGSNHLRISFHSDGSYVFRGFKLFYHAE
ncbi:membrane frizzled-related protein-like [Homarus americanus]|nr:membrane frizzled-related protein-like [Homarus americanus]